MNLSDFERRDATGQTFQADLLLTYARIPFDVVDQIRQVTRTRERRVCQRLFLD